MSNLTESDKLIWLGLKTPQESVTNIENNYETINNNPGGWDDFKDGINDDSVDSWDGYEDYLDNSGVEDPGGFRDYLEGEYGGYNNVDNAVQNDYQSFSDYRNDNQEYSEVINQVSDSYGNDYESFQSDMQNVNSYEEYEDLLVENGVSRENARQFVNSEKEEYGTFTDFEDSLNGMNSYQDFKDDNPERYDQIDDLEGSNQARWQDELSNINDRSVDSWREYKEYLTTEGGLTEQQADQVINSAKDRYGSYGEFENAVQNDMQSYDDMRSELPGVSDSIDTLEQNQSDFSSMQGSFDKQPIENYDELEEYMVDEGGMSEQEASQFVEKTRQNYDSYEDFKRSVDNSQTSDDVVGDYPSNPTFQGGRETEEGEPAGGIRVHENGGTTFDGVDVPPGAVEVFGREVHFSQQGEPKPQPMDLIYSNLRAEEEVVEPGQAFKVKVDVDNPNEESRDETVSVINNSAMVKTVEARVPGGSNVILHFELQFEEIQTLNISVKGLPPLEIAVVPGGVTRAGGRT